MHKYNLEYYQARKNKQGYIDIASMKILRARIYEIIKTANVEWLIIF